ncbi:nucleotide exchange factor GrpE [Aeromicrobium sp. 50.2.37]|uniref:nucleotide exchange factor GrpE n=1 Tax=Aeromicrobium sp. 50.2.37 TaxID=2969305 RepID=UPI00214FA283|nr:nucleotide exchange factor GrpE [Aeromicrobium sp. 50.2.37]MCR4513356.1 nucleotide exchange factor GrpE [Aeromicrobium sp. 50.2.37]
MTAGPGGPAEGADPEVSQETSGEAPADEAVDEVVDETVEVPTDKEEVVDPAAAEEPTEPEQAAEPTPEQQLAERTADLQRLQAEYVNYRRRVERDRAQSRQQGEAAVLRSLLTVLDDIGRAEQHGELTGGFKAVADALHQALKAHKLEGFGAEGDVFDPRLHEALFAAGESPDVQVTSVGPVVRTGYRMGDEVLRHAQVGVVEPASGEATPASDEDE